MSWNGRTRLNEKINECERYANEPYRTSSVMGARDLKQRRMRIELSAILHST